MNLDTLSNHELLEHTRNLVTTESALVLEIIRALREVSRRKIFLALGFASMFDYATRGLSMTSEQAWTRLQIARASEFFPEVITKLRSGEAKPSHMALAVGKLTKANAQLVFNAMNGRSKRQYQAELAKITPDGRIDPAAASAKTKLSFACSEGEMASFEHLRGLLVTQERLAGSGSEDIFSLMVEMCLDQVDPLRRAERAAARQAQKKSAAARASAAAQAPDEALVPGPDLSTAPRRYVPAAVRHEVVQRAQGQCEFVGDEGRRCSARVGLELDHRAVLFCRGGRHEARDLELTCAGHNGLRAERQLGRDFMAKKIQEARTGYKGDERPGSSRRRPSPHGPN